MSSRVLRAGLLLSAVLATGLAAEAAKFAAKLPAFTLEDPQGTKHERDKLLEEHDGLVLVVTAPTASQGDEQEAWSRRLKSEAPEHGRWVLLEDLSQSWFQDTALERMKSEFDPQKPPLLLIDRSGELRKKLGVDDDRTVVLVYDRTGALKHSETEEASVERARAAWAALKGDGATSK